MALPQECRAFTTKYNGIANRILTEVHVAAAFDPATPPANPTLYTTQALWDTGATHSVITEATAKALGLTATGQKLVYHAGGQGNYNTHVVNFFLPNRVAIVGVLVSECPDIGGFGAIIGMDIIAGGDFSISNHQGATWVSFRLPSQQGLDYVADINRVNQEALGKVGRNQACPCGSGKKYKKCHGATI